MRLSKIIYIIGRMDSSIWRIFGKPVAHALSLNPELVVGDGAHRFAGHRPLRHLVEPHEGLRSSLLISLLVIE